MSIDDFVTACPPAAPPPPTGSLSGLAVAWVGVHCDAAVAEQREASRPDRDAGMAAQQALPVHRDVVYDVVVDTTRTSAQDCARAIVTVLRPD